MTTSNKTGYQSNDLPGQPTIADELLKLKSLLDQGLLSHDEFESQKKKLLEFQPAQKVASPSPKSGQTVKTTLTVISTIVGLIVAVFVVLIIIVSIGSSNDQKRRENVSLHNDDLQGKSVHIQAWNPKLGPSSFALTVDVLTDDGSLVTLNEGQVVKLDYLSLDFRTDKIVTIDIDHKTTLTVDYHLIREIMDRKPDDN